MLPRLCADLPAVPGRARRLPEHTLVQERLRREPNGTGPHLWILVRKSGLSAQQAASALARAGECPVSAIRFAAARDRLSECEQWFSVPEDVVVSQASLRNAGYKRMLRVLRVVQADRPVTLGLVQDLHIRARIVGGAEDQGYQKAKAILDRLRSAGCPNYVGAVRLGKGGQWAKWGRMLLAGKRLPPAVRRQRVPMKQCLVAAQAHLFNCYLAGRVGDGSFAQILPGDCVRQGLHLPPAQRELTVVAAEDCGEWQKRVDSWEAVPVGPWYGAEMPAAADAVAQREADCLTESGLTLEQVQRCQGDRRALRFQPRQVSVDIDDADLLISCDIDEEAYISVLLEELLQPEGHLQ